MKSELPDVCPIVATMKMLGNEWTMIAIRYLHDHPMKFNQLKRAMGDVSSKTLSRTLKHLVKEGIIERHVLHSTPISVEYSLTASGRELSDALYDLKGWGSKWLLPRLASSESQTGRP